MAFLTVYKFQIIISDLVYKSDPLTRFLFKAQINLLQLALCSSSFCFVSFTRSFTSVSSVERTIKFWW